MFTGTLVNAVAIIIGSLIGLALKKSFSEKIKQVVFQGIGLFTLVIGMQTALETTNPLILLFSVLIGGIAGQWIDIEDRIERLSNKLKQAIGSDSNTFTEGFMTAFLLFCVGSMGILGSINGGLRGDHALLFTKAALDGFSSIALAASLGIGVLFSVIPLVLYQGGISLFANSAQHLFSPVILSELTAVGGLMIIATGLNLLEIKKIKVINFLPALLVSILLAVILS